MYRIVVAEPRPAYRLWLRFEDGRAGEVDLSGLVGRGVFERWEDPVHFESVFIDLASGTVAWPGGVDLAPDALYRDLESLSDAP